MMHEQQHRGLAEKSLLCQQNNIFADGNGTELKRMKERYRKRVKYGEAKNVTIRKSVVNRD